MGEDEDLIGQAARAARAWGGLRGAPRLVHARENAVFDLRLEDGRRAALRLHRGGYRAAGAIRDELRLCEALADAGFACPWPLRTTAGAFIAAEPGTPVASMVQWIDAPTLAGVESPEARLSVYRSLGRLLADLHLTADAVAPDDLERPAWDVAGLCSPEAPLWGRFWENPALSGDEAALLRRARDAAAARLGEIGTRGMGLIHADVLLENVLVQNRQLYLIDFDDCGWGYRGYDLATALIQHHGSPELPALTEALVEGYLAGEGAFSAKDGEDLPLFMMLRALASAGWVMGRLPQSDPRTAAYAERAVALAGSWLDR